MEIEPAHISQIRLGDDGTVYEYDADAGTVAADLQAIDKGLRVRWTERGHCWIIYHKHHPGCPHNGAGQEGSEYLVTSVQAYQGRTGIWTGLDQRVVDRIRFINPQAGNYDYAKALEAHSKRREERQRKDRAEVFGEMAEVGAHAIRKDLGLGPYKGRVFKPREISREVQ